MTILDVKSLIDINRYQKINIDASAPEEVYLEADMLKPENNINFLKQCAKQITSITFSDRETGNPYARTENGKLVWTDPAGYRAVLLNGETKAGLMAMVRPIDVPALELPAEPQPDAPDDIHTLGQWGPTQQ